MTAQRYAVQRIEPHALMLDEERRQWTLDHMRQEVVRAVDEDGLRIVQAFVVTVEDAHPSLQGADYRSWWQRLRDRLLRRPAPPPLVLIRVECLADW